ncbi:heavy metal translocating P-type ATPase [Coralliovum pocilloporae]|uniref:heavy metal translocating P-type ATPase n=1 Tax=Coralliovum pocilloporae TaxID=3066369 RepID=UPI003306E36B
MSDHVITRDWSAYTRTPEADISEIDLAVEGIHCAACIARIERGIGALDGVRNARLNFTSHRLTVSWDSDRQQPEQFLTTLTKLGYEAQPFDPNRQKDKSDPESRRLMRAIAVSGFAGMNVMLLSISVWSGNVSDMLPETRAFFHWISAVIAIPATLYAGRPFFSSAWAAVRSRFLNMDVPIAIGVLLALGLSIYQTIHHAKHVYFDSALMLLFFLLVGRFLDHSMRGRVRVHAENIAALRSDAANVIGEHGELIERPLSKVSMGDRILVRPGDRIPLDGQVLNGESEIDQSLVTGETQLARISEGSQVFAGTVNGAGALTLSVTAEAGQTVLDEVNRLLETAAQNRSRYVRLADKAAALYAPLVHAAAALTCIGWLAIGAGWEKSLIIAISVLIITCPCALGLAVPAVQVVTSGRLFQHGILLNSGDAIEKLAAVDTVVFDKTGTLTRPKAEVINLDMTPPEYLDKAIRLAKASRHPLSLALAECRPMDEAEAYQNVTEITGKGVECTVDGEIMRLGHPIFCNLEAAGQSLSETYPNASLIAFRHGEETAVFAIEQQLRTDALETINALKERGYQLAILSGDRQSPVDQIANHLKIENRHFGLDPKQKVDCLAELARDGRTTLMVGDGLNDAAALAAAHVSLSPVTATDLAQTSSDAVFLGERLAPVKHALSVAINARHAMDQNMALAVVYNIVAVPFAVLGFVTPLVAALAMSGSSLVVTANALRLKWKR